jgi:hypothetical protein
MSAAANPNSSNLDFIIHLVAVEACRLPTVSAAAVLSRQAMGIPLYPRAARFA